MVMTYYISPEPKICFEVEVWGIWDLGSAFAGCQHSLWLYQMMMTLLLFVPNSDQAGQQCLPKPTNR